jgi:hypothetical protein
MVWDLLAGTMSVVASLLRHGNIVWTAAGTIVVWTGLMWNVITNDNLQ